MYSNTNNNEIDCITCKQLYDILKTDGFKGKIGIHNLKTIRYDYMKLLN